MEKGKIYKLGEVCEIKGTGIVGWHNQKRLHNQVNWKNGTVPYYQIKDIQNQILYPERKLLPEVVAHRCSAQFFPKNSPRLIVNMPIKTKDLW